MLVEGKGDGELDWGTKAERWEGDDSSPPSVFFPDPTPLL